MTNKKGKRHLSYWLPLIAFRTTLSAWSVGSTPWTIYGE